jgi:hypothetical protein
MVHDVIQPTQAISRFTSVSIEASDAEKTLWALQSLELGIPEAASARALAIPSSTLNDRLKPLKTAVVSPQEFAFFNSESGKTFIERLLFGLIFCVNMPKSSSKQSLSNALHFCGLGRFAPISYGSLCARAKIVESGFLACTKAERKRMLKNSKTLYITLCMDETWLDLMYLVAIDAVSGFILLEKASESRSEKSWADELQHENPDLKIVIIQATSDEAAALIRFAKERTIGNHSPDLFHVLNEISKGLSLPLHHELRASENEVAALIDEHREVEQAILNELAQPSEGNTDEITEEYKGFFADLDEAIIDRNNALILCNEFRACLNDFSSAYHPVDLTTGSVRSTATVMADIYTIYGRLQDCASPFDSKKILFHIEKARRVCEPMEKNLDFVQWYVRETIQAEGFSDQIARQIGLRLVPAAYLQRVAGQMKDREKSKKVLELARVIREKAVASFSLSDLPEATLERIFNLATSLSGVFQRSSSCVEGRNGFLSLKFHNSRGLSCRQIEIFTGLANFVSRRSDGTTAATRFFHMKQRDIMEMTYKMVC